MEDERMEKQSKIHTWTPTERQTIVEKDGKLFLCHFDKLLGSKFKDRLDPYQIFIIGKDSYINQLDIICRYINFFMNEYDADKELVMAYLKIKFALDKEKLFDASNMEAYIDFLYEILFTDTMIDKIIAIVEENYLDDIESSTEEKKKYLKNEKKHLESLEFTNQHIKLLLQISFAIKIMSPVLFHYIQKSHIKIEKDSEIIFQFYKRFFDIFSHGNDYEIYDAKTDEEIRTEIPAEEAEQFIKDNNLTITKIGDERRYYFIHPDLGTDCFLVKRRINMYNKLYVYVKAKVLESNANNAPIFSQREIFGVDVYSVVNQFTKKVIISENLVKYKFNEHWDPKLKKYQENVIGFNKTILKYQLSYFLKEQYQKNITEVTNTKNSEGLSGSDKMLMNATKIDEGIVVMADLNIKMTIDRVKRMIDIPVSKEEVQYYMDNHHPDKIQIQLVHAFFTKYFGSQRDLALLTKRDYITLALLLKKKLLLDLGYEDTESGEIHYATLPYLLTGNVSDKVNTRIIRNNKFINKIEENEMYKELMETKFALLESIKPETILSLLSSLINTRFTYVTYENQDLLGQEIYYSEDKVSDEVLYFLSIL